MFIIAPIISYRTDIHCLSTTELDDTSTTKCQCLWLQQ